MIKFISDGRLVRRFPTGTPVSSTNKTDHHDITDILLKVALNNIIQPNHQSLSLNWRENKQSKDTTLPEQLNSIEKSQKAARLIPLEHIFMTDQSPDLEYILQHKVAASSQIFGTGMIY